MHEVIVHEDLRVGDQLLGAKRHQSEITRTGADKINDTSGRHEREKESSKDQVTSARGKP
jgi:hypothetical protein